MRSRIMYIESKAEGLNGRGRIGRVTYSKTGSTVYYRGKSFKSLKGDGYKANYYDIATGTSTGSAGQRKPAATGSTALRGSRSTRTFARNIG